MSERYDRGYPQALKRIEELEAKLEKSMEALRGVREFVRDLGPPDQGNHLVPALYAACMVLKELEESTDE